ncbi:TIGR04222 domain-containing membrane protein [Streptomyces sp. NPDC001941]|uniref:TIGR04222 domain-containing membrane protein n=1 Tax=Streptomyces sp. NPDC001941 TaxID=3154659 RepID=UPI003327DD3F
MNTLALLVYAYAVATSAFLITGVSRARRRGPGARVHDVAEAAFLTGGPARVVDAALAALHSDGRLVIGGPGIVSVRPGAAAREPVERAVLAEHAAAPSGALHHLRLAVMRGPAVQEVGDGLAARGLLVPPAVGRRLRRRGATVLLCHVLVAVVSVVLTVVDLADATADDIPVPFVLKVIPGLFVGFLVAGACTAAGGKRISASGRAAVLEYREGYVRVHGAPTAVPNPAAPHDPAHLVALFGLRALPDPVLRAQLQAAAQLVTRDARRSSLAAATSSSSSGAPIACNASATWCASSTPGGSGCGGGGGSNCSSGSGGCGGSGGSSCGGSGCGGSSSGSSCGSSSSSCGSSSSSCGGSSG